MTVKADNRLWVERDFESLRGRTLKTLREAILARHLAPGQRLVERDLCQQTGVSRSSIREALRHLESEGLIESRGSKGMFVSVLSKRQALEIYEVRAALEAEAARHFAERATDEELQALKAGYERIVEVAYSDPDAYGREIDGFFEVLFAGAGNATAHALIRSLRARINLLRNTTIRLASKERTKGSLAKMKNIVEALEKRDGGAAVQACRSFVARSAEFAASQFEGPGGDDRRLAASVAGNNCSELRSARVFGEPDPA
jgi:DNA-binding GntR family transcriptional regulator